MLDTTLDKKTTYSSSVGHRIYFDNAATTALDKEVLDAMLPYMTDHFGNPSSIYSYGRETRLAIENARKTVARLLGVSPGSIFLPAAGRKVTIQPSLRPSGTSAAGISLPLLSNIMPSCIQWNIMAKRVRCPSVLSD